MGSGLMGDTKMSAATRAITTTTTLTIPGHGRTSMRLEAPFREALRHIAARRLSTRNQVVQDAIAAYPELGMSSAVRCYCVKWMHDCVTLVGRRASADEQDAGR